MSHKTNALTALKSSIIFNLILALFCTNVQARKLKAGLEYTLPKAQKIKLRVSQIPSKYPWIERDDDWKVKLPEIGSEIIAENVEPIKLKDPYGKSHTLPEGTKFFAKLVEAKDAKSFWRKEQVKLSFYKMQIPGQENIELSHSIDFDSKKQSHIVSSTLGNIAAAGGYIAAGAIAAPLITYGISSSKVLALGALSNPYVLGGAAAIGGGIGLAYGIKRKGKKFGLEPGKDIKIKIEDPWLIAEKLDVVATLNEEKGKPVSKTGSLRRDAPHDSEFKLKVLKIKKTKDEFNDPCLRISIDYENLSGEELRYTSFQLVDSMGKEYEPSLSSFTEESFDHFDGLPQKAKLDLYFTSDFPKTAHNLRVLRLYDQKELASAKIVLK